MATTGNLDTKPVTLNEARKFVKSVSAKARGGNTLKATKTGNLISVDDAYAGALLGLTVYGNSVQDGTPTPENPVAIKSVANVTANTASVNLWGGEHMRDSILAAIPAAVASSDSDGEYVSFAASNKASSPFVNQAFKPNTQYTLILSAKKSSNVGVNIRINYSDGSYDNLAFTDAPTVKTTFVFVTKADYTVKSIVKLNHSGTTYLYYNECALLEGVHTAADLVPSVGTTTPLTLVDDQGVAHELKEMVRTNGVVLRQDKLVINSDGSGTLYENVGYVADISTLTWTKITTPNTRFRATLPGFAGQPSVARVLCEAYPHMGGASAEAEINDKSLYKRTSYGQIIIRNSDYDSYTAEEFAATLSGISVLYAPLANETTYHIPAINMPSLPDLVSNAWVSATDADGATIACECGVTYRRDINKVVADIEEAIADIVSA